jgi:hypothetical protein
MAPFFLDADQKPREHGSPLFLKVFCPYPLTRGRNTEGEIMSIINKPPEMVKREYELQEPIALAVEKYATFIQSTPDHVVNSALKMVIWRDVEFRRWRKQQTPGEKKDAVAKAARA